MFQSSTNRLRAWVSRLDDILADHPDETRPWESDFRNHPHRRELRWDRPRRPGTVDARPAHCISPVRAAHETDAQRTSTTR
jgi:hypothetical protein